MQAGVTQIVYLDFDTFTVAGKHEYVQADRDAGPGPARSGL